MDFTTIPYQRPELTNYQQLLAQAAADMQAAASGEAAVSIARGVLPQMNAVMTAGMLASIRHSVDTRDLFYAEEDAFWNEFGPQFDNAERPYLEALVASPYRESLEAIYPRPYFLKAANQLRVQKPEALALQQEENQLVSRYDELIAQAQVEFAGRTYTLAQLQAPIVRRGPRRLGLIGDSSRRTVQSSIGFMIVWWRCGPRSPSDSASPITCR